jgi:ribonuclease III
LIGLLRRRRLSADDRELFDAIKNIFGFSPRNISLYRLAFQHKSSAPKSQSGFKHSNERLEYLGDAVFGSVVADFLFKKYPFKDEGFLTEIRSRIVSRSNLNSLARKLGFDGFLKTSRENITPSTSIFGDAFEAFVGALYLDKGYEFTRKIIIKRIISCHLDIDVLVLKETNFKSRLIEWAQKERKHVDFQMVDESINGRSLKVYSVKVYIDNNYYGEGKDFSIKRAEQNAAEMACSRLEEALAAE